MKQKVQIRDLPGPVCTFIVILISGLIRWENIQLCVPLKPQGCAQLVCHFSLPQRV